MGYFYFNTYDAIVYLFKKIKIFVIITAKESVSNNNITYKITQMMNGGTTYYINTQGSDCFNSTGGIYDTYNCAVNNQVALDLGTFTDTHQSGSQLSSMTLLIYGACSGTQELFLNGVSIAGRAITGPMCGCETIAATPSIPQEYTVTITPAIQAAFIAGGENTLSVKATNSVGSVQCFYGADVTLDVAPSTPISNWAIYIGILLIAMFMFVGYRRRLFA